MSEFPNQGPSPNESENLWQDSVQDNAQNSTPNYGPNVPPPLPPQELWGMTQNTYLMLMHLSQLVGFAAPVLGLLAPILMWALNKDKHPEVDAQGKIILNWIISVFIYAIVSVLLCFILVGIPILLALLVLDIVFPIMGAVKANDGIRWKYPLSIPFFKVEERHG